MRAVLFVALGFVLLAVTLPALKIAGLTGSIERTLEVALNRKVTFAKAHLMVFPIPGFSLEKVTIQENSEFGLEPFAYVNILEIRIRIDKLLLGQLRPASFRLVDPSLNLVKQNDGKWNVVDLVERLSAPRRAPLNLLPAIEISDGRIDFKFGTRKTMLYIAQTNLSIYPERSGKVYFQFSGSPARTDRAGNGFGHLRGSANWYLSPASSKADQVDAELTLDPSNLSELTTLLQGHDLGVHGTLSARARLRGPATALLIDGDLHLEDVHRWDLLPASGEDWWIGYKGRLDLLAHQFDLTTSPFRPQDPTPVVLQVKVNNFLARPAWSVFATLNKAPTGQLLPLGRRMGLPLPPGLALEGKLDGVVGYSSRTGLAGGITISEGAATLPNASPLRASSVHVSISSDEVHFDPADVNIGESGSMQVGGDYHLSSRQSLAWLTVSDYRIKALKNTMQAWFGAPVALFVLDDGTVSGHFAFQHQEPSAGANANPDFWSGQFQFADAGLSPDGFAAPLTQGQGRVSFNADAVDVTHFSAALGTRTVSGSYHYSFHSRRPDRVHLDVPAADLSEIEAALDPTLQSQSLWARLHVTRRNIPAWLAGRNLDGEMAIDRFSMNGTELGPLTAHFAWQGTNVHFSSLRLNLPEGLLRAQGNVNLASYSPKARFTGTLTGLPWNGGFLNAKGDLQTTGTGQESLRNLQLTGTFRGEQIRMSTEDFFDQATGEFNLSFPAKWPDLRISNLTALEGEQEWSGQAATQSDGKLTVDLVREGRQLHFVSSLLPPKPVDTGELNRTPQQ